MAGETVDLSIGAPSAPQVAGGVGEAVHDAAPKKRTSRSTTSTSTSSPPPAPAPTGLDELDEPLPNVTMDQVRVVVMSAGLMLSMAIGDDDVPDHWRFTEAELAALVPPLTSVINRRPALRRAVQRSDEVTIALMLAGYAGRNVDTWRAAKKVRDQLEVEGGREDEAGGPAGAAAPGGQGAARGTGWPAGVRGSVPGATG